MLEFMGSKPTTAATARTLLNNTCNMGGSANLAINHLKRIGDTGLFFVKVSNKSPMVQQKPIHLVYWFGAIHAFSYN